MNKFSDKTNFGFISLTWVLLVIAIIIVLTGVFGFVIERMAKLQLTNGINPMFSPLEELAANVSKISEGRLDYVFR